ncbi:MAG: histidine kinase [Gemmatimonadaceae bacterium]|nr:histidine kinase [Chitinophagaceae bacterium]
MALPQYTKQDLKIFLGSMPGIVVILNSLLFGKRYFTELRLFGAASLMTLAIMTGCWLILTWVAVTVRNRFTHDTDMMRRLGMTLFLIIIITSLTITLIFYGYDFVRFGGYQLNETVYEWTLAVGFIINVFVTFLHEGVASFEKWRATLSETESLKKEYMQSRLLGLKSQVNPHFLFNSLNSLSSLISENAQQAEKFLDELSKVYRYLLRNSDDHLVPLETEIQFMQSYYHLLKERYGDALFLEVDVLPEHRTLLIPPLTIQMLVENALNCNTISKLTPLRLGIVSTADGHLKITNNMQLKIGVSEDASRECFDNIANKFRLLGQSPIAISEETSHRVVELPLIHETQPVAV